MPSGALTFLFTDIEASTRRWEADAAAMSAALTEHDEILRAAIASAGGSVFKHTGDGMCAVFGSAAAALAGAIAAQRQLAAGPLRVRMAIHARDNDYFGPTLNRAARLMAAAWGGQTLVSAAAAELAGHALPPGATLRPSAAGTRGRSLRRGAQRGGDTRDGPGIGRGDRRPRDPRRWSGAR